MGKGKNDKLLEYLMPDDIDEVILPMLKAEKAKKKMYQKRIVEKKLSLMKCVVFCIFLVCLGIASFSGYQILAWKIDSDKTYAQMELIADNAVVEEVEDTEATEIVNPPVEEDPANPYWDYIKINLINVDFSNLLEINSDTKGWLQVSGTNINYPFVQTTNNDYYLKRDFNKEYNSAGWVYLDYRNNINELDKNTIIYAHGRLNGTMFGSLKNIFNSDWFDDINNHVVKLSTPTENTLWQVFSVYHIPTTSDYLQVKFSNDTDFLDFINMLKSRSQYDFNVEFSAEDKILTLSTCYNDEERVVLHAKLIKREVRE